MPPALEVTFKSRGRQVLPASLPPPPSDWAVAYRKHAREVGIDPDVVVGHSEAAALLDPILAGQGNGRWDPEKGRWSSVAEE